jgi:hypothetical protein
LTFYKDEPYLDNQSKTTRERPNICFFQEPTEAAPMPVPEWGIDIKCGKATNFSYGPWADRQRELIYKFFFPPDYQVSVS